MLLSLGNLPLGVRLGALIAILATLAVALAGGGLVAMDGANSRLKAVYEERVIPMEQLTGIVGRVLHNRLLLSTARAKIAGGEAIDVQEMQAALQRNLAAIDQSWKKYLDTQLTPEERALAENLAKARKQYLEEGVMPVVDALRQFQTAEYVTAAERSDALFPLVEKGLDELIQLQMNVALKQKEAGAVAFLATRNIMIASLVAGLGLALVLAYLVASGITRPVEAMRAALIEAQRSNDLTCRVAANAKDEIGQMAQAFNDLMEGLQGTLKKVVDGAHKVSSAATQVASASGQISAHARTQSESAASTAAAVEQVTVSINQVAANTRETKHVSEQACALSSQGETTARAAAGQMVKTADSVGASARLLQALSQRSIEISGIVKVIREIAEQTNLLALNAAIEAARAGEQGRGFAVVADEVRKLAERTSASTGEISTVIEAIQNEVHSAVENLKANNEQVGEGKQLAEEVAAVLARINVDARTTLERVNDISSATDEQSTASNDIARNVERIAQMTEETTTAIAQTCMTARQLEELASQLHTEVARFQV